MCPWPNQRTNDEFPLSQNRRRRSLPMPGTTRPRRSARPGHRRAAQGLGVKEQLFVVDTGGHGAFHYGVVEGPGTEWPEALLAWLKQIELVA